MVLCVSCLSFFSSATAPEIPILISKPPWKMQIMNCINYDHLANTLALREVQSRKGKMLKNLSKKYNPASFDINVLATPDSVNSKFYKSWPGTMLGP